MEDIFSLLAKSLLHFSHGIIIASLLIVGFLTRGGFFINPPSSKGFATYGNAVLLVLFTMIFSALLKSLFLVPLNPALRLKGYAFPSGHMQVSVVFYGALFLAYSNPIFRKFLLFIIVGIGYGLIQQGYHNLWDVAGAVAFGVLTLVAFAKVTTLPSIQKNPTRLSLYLLPLAALMVAGRAFRTGLSPHAVITFLGLIGFSLLWCGLSYYFRSKEGRE
jgi:membrane-associated phospholipid phosphatase